MYDVLAGKENMESSYLMSKGKALETFPMLKSDGLVGALVYYDGGIPLSVYIHVLSQRWGIRSTQRRTNEHRPHNDCSQTWGNRCQQSRGHATC
jgi:hypothetical protein